MANVDDADAHGDEEDMEGNEDEDMGGDEDEYMVDAENGHFPQESQLPSDDFYASPPPIQHDRKYVHDQVEGQLPSDDFYASPPPIQHDPESPQLNPEGISLSVYILKLKYLF